MGVLSTGSRIIHVYQTLLPFFMPYNPPSLPSSPVTIEIYNSRAYCPTPGSRSPIYTVDPAPRTFRGATKKNMYLFPAIITKTSVRMPP